MSTKDAPASKKPANTAFKQQRLKAWQPILTPKPVILSFLIIGIVFIPIGIGIVISSNEVIEIDVQYDHTCDIGQVCNITLEVPKDMKAPVYLYYRLDNYYQNHRRYVKSRSDTQLRLSKLENSPKYTDLQDCDPYISENDVRDDPNRIYFPCGDCKERF